MPFRKATTTQIAEFSRILDKKYRKQAGLFQIEGVHLVEEMLRNGKSRPQWIGVTEEFIAGNSGLTGQIAKAYDTCTFLLNARELRKLTDTETPQGIVAAVEQIRPTIGDILKSKAPVLLLDGISDPGNLGTLIRTADWFGVDGILLTPDCVEWYNPKVVRSSMGSVFRVRGSSSSIESALEQSRSKGRPIVGASAEGKIGAPIPADAVLVMGNESRGLSRDVRRRCDVLVAVAGAGKADSLNVAVACGILLHEVLKERR